MLLFDIFNKLMFDLFSYRTWSTDTITVPLKTNIAYFDRLGSMSGYTTFSGSIRFSKGEAELNITDGYVPYIDDASGKHAYVSTDDYYLDR